MSDRSPDPAPPATVPAQQAPPRAPAAVPRRTAPLILGVLAAAGGAAIHLAALPAMLRASIPYGVCLAALGLLQIGTAAVLLVRPRRSWLLAGAAVAAAVAAGWGLDRLGALPDPDPWQPVNAVVGITGAVAAGLQVLAAVVLAGLAVRGPGPRPSTGRRVVAGLLCAPVAVAVLVAGGLGVAAASDGFAGAGFPAGTVAPRDLPAGQRSTVEYCRPRGVPLAMDIYTPAAATRPSPVVLYVHGGGLMLGDRRTTGLGASLANHEGALFTDVRRRLNERGMVVAAIDYRLPPGTAWPAQIQDAACAVRFLRAHAAALGVDPTRVAAWGSSAGATLACLLGLAGPDAGFDVGPYREQSSAVGAVVDMFSPADLTDVSDSSAFMRTIMRIALGGSAGVRRAASPIAYVRRGAPPFLIMHGTDDQDVRPRHSERLARALRAVGTPVTLVRVSGAEHGLDAAGERPDAGTLAGTVADFLTGALA